MATSSSDTTKAPQRGTAVYEGLLRMPLFGGVPFKVLIMEGALSGTLVIMGQFSFFAIALALLGGCGVHVVMKTLIDGDPTYMQQLRSALRYKGYYAPHAHWNASPPEEERPPIST